MKGFFLILLLLSLSYGAIAQVRTVHVYVALCDNQYQGIVPVSETLGNGKDPTRNLYWGAAYGVKSFLRHKTTDWEIVETLSSDHPAILERILFRHKTDSVFMLAEAYDGEQIKSCVEDFLRSSNGQKPIEIRRGSTVLKFGGAADLLAYVGHDGLMDFNVKVDYRADRHDKKEVIILACYSKTYFSPELKKAQAEPVLWTTHLMAPEAYTLKAALDGWILGETNVQIEERAAQAYNEYQTCGINGARNLFATGF